MDTGGQTVLLAILALASTQAILADIANAIPHVLHSLPLKVCGVYAVLYGATKSHISAVRGFMIFVVLIWILTIIEDIVDPDETGPMDNLHQIIG